MTDWEAFRQALPETAPKELIDWAMRTQKDELGGELCLFSLESVSWLEDEPQKIMTPEDIERREKTRRRTWGARCSCTACGEDFTAGWLRGLKLPGNREIRGIALLQGDDGLLYEGIPDMEDACWRMSAAEIAETDHFDCPLCGADVQLVRRKDLRSGRTHQVYVVTVEVIHGVTVLLYWMVRREFNEYGGSGAAAWPREAIALTEKGGLKRFTRAKCNQFGTEWDTGEWRAVRQMRDPETVKYYSWEANSHKKIGAAVRPEVPDLTGSTGEKTGLEDYIRAGGQWPVQYLKLWKQHRNVENLARAGWGRTLGGAIEEMAWNQVTAPYAKVHEIELRWIDWNEVKPGRMLGMSKAEVRALAGRWDWQTADAWAVYRYWKGDCTAEEFDRCRAGERPARRTGGAAAGGGRSGGRDIQGVVPGGAGRLRADAGDARAGDGSGESGQAPRSRTGAAGAGKDGVGMSNPNPGTENIKWIEYGGTAVIRGGYNESVIEYAERLLAEQAVETVRQIMEEDRSVFRFRKGAEDNEVVVEWRIKIPKFNWRERMKIYIAGAITGDPEYREKFRRAEEAVRAEGHVAVNPAVLPEGLEPGDYMRICTAMLDSCDAIALLRDWAHSKGACIEMTYAQYVGKKLMRLWDMPDGLWVREGI